MTDAAETAGLWDRPIGRLVVRAVVCALAAAGLLVFAGGPTWGAVGLSIVFTVSTFLAGLLCASLFGLSADPERRVGVVMVTHIALQELIRLGLVLWSGVGAVEAAWIGLLTWSIGLALGLLGLMRLSTAERGTGQKPEPALGPVNVLAGGGMLATETAPWALVVWSPLLALLTFAVRAGAGLLQRGTQRKQVFTAAGGYLLLALALVLWLSPVGQV
ncbi:hypothetical protein FE391_35440 [Nonomuraea sp. KC401]|uniref:hypothetical protein n=1 Tax=unclassified Nonomuraea TaxID=2593643 RepID=UPI0010FE19E3|nr:MULTISPECIES: hypothetical protein [unclassified Nonomuraea]NBE93299.1 hypothetical protein [Nonomuraea sp. K271]TLF59014.1 hypothetical protein FE391_35440 [Nonomuraea sp. KC401]